MRQRWAVEELAEFWTLEADELALVANKAGTTRLGFAVLLKFFSVEGRFPQPGEVSPEVVDFVARQVGVEFDAFGRYDWSGRSWKRHRGQIRSHFSFRAWSEPIVKLFTMGSHSRTSIYGSDGPEGGAIPQTLPGVVEVVELGR